MRHNNSEYNNLSLHSCQCHEEDDDDNGEEEEEKKAQDW